MESHVDTNFVDPLAVKEGRVAHGRVAVSVAEGELLLHDRTDVYLEAEAEGDQITTVRLPDDWQITR